MLGPVLQLPGGDNCYPVSGGRYVVVGYTNALNLRGFGPGGDRTVRVTDMHVPAGSPGPIVVSSDGRPSRYLSAETILADLLAIADYLAGVE